MHRPSTPLWCWPVLESHLRKGSAVTAFTLHLFALFIGLDVGKSEHHATALTSDGTKVYDKPLPSSEPKLFRFLTKLVSHTGRRCWWWSSPLPCW